MTARRSTSDLVSHYLETGERVVWRHRPEAPALFYNRLPTLVIALLISAFIAWVASTVIGAAVPDQMPTALSAWFIIPAILIGVALFVLYFYARFIWNSICNLIDNGSTYYALTDRRLMIVSKRGLVDYDRSYFRQMDVLDGPRGRQVLLFDFGPLGKRRRDHYRDRIAGLPDAPKLQRLIRETLGA